MPCLAIHLAVAKKYLEKHSENSEEFILGTIAPDIEIDNINNYINGEFTDKNSRHFGENFKTDNVIDYMRRKVSFKKFFEQNDLNTSFRRAYFLHLLCDYCFFGEYITNEKIKDIPFMDIVKIGYNDYNIITPKLIKEYDLTIPEQIKDMVNGEGIGEIKLLDESIIDSFIEDMSNNDLEEKGKELDNI